ncbi:MAG: hypothetical protein S4CHLAM2_07860 [Chlamydiales bacterium]|nr:hypothetical protein [Chlamydiales bacterium]
MSTFQLKSMTAYGRGVSSFTYGSLTIEIQSVNRRHLEMNLSLPRLLTCFEMLIRKKIAQHVGRGMVNVLVGWRSEAKNRVMVTPNLPLAKGIKQGWEKIASDLGLQGEISLSLLAREKDLFLLEEELPDEESFRAALDQGLDEALEPFLQMKRAEGEALACDLHRRLERLQEWIQVIEACAPSVPIKYRERLTERLEGLFAGNGENEERILREVALLAERADVTEEIVRFKSHLKQFQERLEAPLAEPTETRGKTLDFLLQELNREINTVGSKASELAITQHVVTVKSELEKMREQVQNIE